LLFARGGKVINFEKKGLINGFIRLYKQSFKKKVINISLYFFFFKKKYMPALSTNELTFDLHSKFTIKKIVTET